MLHGTIVLGIFSVDFGGKVLCHYNFSVKRLPMTHFFDQRKLLLWSKLPTHGNSFLLSLLRLVQNRFYAVASGYDISSISVSVSRIKSAVWAKFTDFVT